MPRRAKVRGRRIAVPRPWPCMRACIVRVWPFTVRMVGYFLQMTPRGSRSLMGWITPFPLEIIGRFIGSRGVRSYPRWWAIRRRIQGDLWRPRMSRRVACIFHWGRRRVRIIVGWQGWGGMGVLGSGSRRGLGGCWRS